MQIKTLEQVRAEHRAGKREIASLTIVSKDTEGGTRYFTEPGNVDGFDGTAQGWGYKSSQAIYRAYAYFQNRDKIKSKEMQAKQFLRDNPDVAQMLQSYFDPDWMIDRLKDGEESTIAHLIVNHVNQYPAEIAKLKAVQPLHRAITQLIIR